MTAAIVLALLLLGVLPAVHAVELPIEEAITAQQAQAEVQRRLTVSNYMAFTPEESQKFWTSYRRYRDAVGETVKRRIRAITEYVENQGRLSDDEARRLLNEYIANEETYYKVRRRYAREFGRFLPGGKVARFFQLENKLASVVLFGLIQRIPLVMPDES